MRIIDRYITKSVIAVFVGTVVVFALLFILIDSASNLDEFIDRNVPFPVLLEYYLSYLPVIMVEISSIAALIAVLFTYTNLNAHNEVIALRASGLTFWQITKPALCFGLVMSAVVFCTNELYIPKAMEQTRQIKNDHLVLEVDRQDRKRAVITNLTFYGRENRLYFIDSYDPNTRTLEGIKITEFKRADSEAEEAGANIREKIVALKGEWTGLAWKFYQVRITTFRNDPKEAVTARFYPEKSIAIKETPEDFKNQSMDVRSMNSRQLADYIGRFASSGATGALRNLRVDLFQKFTLPLRNIVIILVGLPFVLLTGGKRKAQTFSAIGIALSIGFLYYVTEAVGLALGKGGILPPVLAAGLAPILFTGAALYVIQERF